VLFSADGSRLELPREINLWETDLTSRGPATVVSPLNPADYQIDPLAFV
jgi:hypothetical protein